ncbi:MAG: hypothetical protein KAH23_03180 [Kiritimatiellae bacterium]|nr:hypothetical protein [Kiritimatiellia bacterium]
MKTKILIAGIALALISMNMPCYAQDSVSKSDKKYGDPKRFEKNIQEFQATDKEHPPPEGAIVCIGSSSMRGWRRTIQKDLAPLTVIPRGFGGSNMNDALYYVDRIVLSYKPRAIVVYEGDNDIAQGIAPKKIADTFRAFVAKVQNEYPDCRVYFLSIKPSIRRWHLWPSMQKANSLIATECTKDKRLVFVDVASGMLDDEGNPRKELFKKDNLHMTRDGYVIWRDALMPILLETEIQFETQKDASAGKTKNVTSSKTDPGDGK